MTAALLRVAATTVIMAVFSVESSVSQSAEDTDALYRATIAVAEASLRLHETDRAKEWLARAPSGSRGWEWRYLTGQSDRSASAVALEGGALADLAVSRDGRYLAAAMGSGAVHLLDAASGGVVRTFEGHTASAWSPVFSSDGRRLATASSDGTARVWDVAAGRQLIAMEGNGRGVAAIAWSPDESTLAVSSWDRTPERGIFGTLNLYDARTGRRLRHEEHGDYPIASLAWSRDGSSIIGGTWDWDLVIWDTRTWGEPRVLPPPESPDYKRIEDFSLSADGTRLAVAYADGRARIWDVGRGVVVQTLNSAAEGLIKNIADVAFLPDGDVIATVGGDLTMRLWDAALGTPLAVYHGHERPILTVAVSPDGRWLYTGGAGGRLRTWDLESLGPGRSTWRIPHAEAAERGASTVYDVAFHPDHRRAVVTTFEGWLRIVDVETGRASGGWRASDEAAVGADWSPNGRWIVSTDNVGRTVLWDAASGKAVQELQHAGRQLLNAAFHPDGSLVAAPGAGPALRLWAVPSGEPVADLVDGDAEAGDLAWSTEGVLAAAYDDGAVRLWDARTGAILDLLRSETSGAPAVAFDPSGQRLAVVHGRSVKIWDVAARDWIADWSPRSASARSVSWSPDGRRIGAALSGNMFEVWDASSGATLLRLPQAASAWMVRWTQHDELVLVPLDGTVRVLRAPEAPAPAADTVVHAVSDTVPWREKLEYLAAGSGVWITSNAEYRTAENGEPAEYGMRYWMGLGDTAQHGCLWGRYEGQEPVFWSFFTAWDPARGQLLVQQSAAHGVIGIGYETPGTGIAEQRFTAPDGTAWDQRHVSTHAPPDTLTTQSFQKSEDGSWQPRRSYQWIRQPAGTQAPC